MRCPPQVSGALHIAVQGALCQDEPTFQTGCSLLLGADVGQATACRLAQDLFTLILDHTHPEGLATDQIAHLVKRVATRYAGELPVTDRGLELIIRAFGNLDPGAKGQLDTCRHLSQGILLVAALLESSYRGDPSAALWTLLKESEMLRQGLY